MGNRQHRLHLAKNCVFYYRISKQFDLLNNIKYYGKMGGATGNLNAHIVVHILILIGWTL